MVALKLILNFCLLATLLVFPCLLLMAHWYRKQVPRTLMVWKKPEQVIITITFSVIVLILFIVGLSSIFTFLGYLDSSQFDPSAQERFKTIAIVCLLSGVSLFFMYVAIRILLVQVVTEQGIVSNDRFLRIPNFRDVIKWHEISDYYVKSDYPNVIFTLIIQRQALEFDRVSIRVPVYNRDEFESLLEAKMYSAKAIKARSEISRHKFSEN